MSISLHKHLCAFLALSCMAAPAMAAALSSGQPSAGQPSFITLAMSEGGKYCCAEYGKRCVKKDKNGKCVKEAEVCVKWQKPPCRSQK